MDCRSARSVINSAVLGALEPEAQREVRAHLSCCPACYVEFERSRRVLCLLADGRCAAGPGGLELRIFEAGRTRAARERTGLAGLWRRLVGSASAI